MRTALVGYTGFVGSNIYAAGQFDGAYNSKNIEEAFGTNPDLLVYAGLKAEKYLANKEPEKDRGLIRQAVENIKKINPKKLVLISTIDVFKVPRDVDENSVIDTKGLPAYGYNRYQLELWVRETYPDALIIRLPGLFGRHIKKNFIYDYIHMIPSMLSEVKFEELAARDSELRDYYKLQDNGFYRVNALEKDTENLKNKFGVLGFSALNFTDSRSVFQFYNLERLWEDIKSALNAGLTVWHPATEPISAGELYMYLTGKEFINKTDGIPAKYNYKTVYSNLFGGAGAYICDKQKILVEIKEFIEEEKFK